jgi:hypothetical protein
MMDTNVVVVLRQLFVNRKSEVFFFVVVLRTVQYFSA